MADPKGEEGAGKARRSSGKKIGLWAPSRGFLAEGGGGGEAPVTSPAQAAAPAPPQAAGGAPEGAEAGGPKAAAAPRKSSGKGGGLWAPSRGYLDGGAPAAAPAAKAAAPAEARPAAPAPAAPAAKAPAEGPAAPKAPAAKSAAAPKPAAAPAKAAAAAAMAKPAEEASDPLRESVTAVPRLAEHPSFQGIGEAVYDEPDSETTLYRVPTLNAIFAVSSALLLLSLVMVFWQDYDRQWKRVQKDWEAELVRSFRGDLEKQSAVQRQVLEELETPLGEILSRLSPERAAVVAARLPVAAPAADDPARFRVQSMRLDRLISETRSLLARDEEYRRLEAAFLQAQNLADLKDKQVRAFKGDFQAQKFAHEEEKRHVLLARGETRAAQERIAALTAEFNARWVEPLERGDRELEALQAEESLARRLFEQHVKERTALAALNGGAGRSLVDIEAQIAPARQKIVNIEKQLELVDTNWRNALRNAPLMDALAPSYKIDKVVLPDLPEDVHFETKTARVDRCKTCHINIDNPDPAVVAFQSARWGSVYKSHPRLDLYLSASSPHPYESFGCSTCHYGDGHALEFTISAHTPSTHAQEEEWIARFGWDEHKLHHQDWPMLPRQHMTASCGKCHTSEQRVDGAERYNLGREIVRTYGCFGCHRIDGFETKAEDQPDIAFRLDKVGPDLKHIAEKTTPEFLYKWIRAPAGFRPSTRMPRFFDLSNSTGEMLALDARGVAHPMDFESRNGVEVLAIASYLYETSERRPDLEPPGIAGDPARGREHFRTLGCLGCHSVTAERQTPEASPPPALVDVERALRAAAAARRGQGRARAGDGTALATAYDEVAGRIGELARWLEKLAVGKELESLYHRARLAIERARALEERLQAGDSPLGGAEELAAAIYDSWAHNTFAPDLSSIGSKFDLSSTRGREQAEAWLTDWIIHPERHDPNTVMPSFRLAGEPGGAQKVADIVSYLLSLRDPAFETLPALSPEQVASGEQTAKALDDLAFDHLRRNHGTRKAAELAGSMNVEEKLVYVGHRLIRRYGCFGCHNGIRDEDPDPESRAKLAALPPDDPARRPAYFDGANPIGTELNEWGFKEAAKLDFGQWGHQPDGREAIPHKRYAWAKAKLQNTRRFDVLPAAKAVDAHTVVHETTNRLIQKTPEELLKMPLFPFHDDEEEVEAAVTFLLSLVKEPIGLSKIRRLDEKAMVIERGNRLVEKFNCAGCHRIGAVPQSVPADELPLFSDYDAGEAERWREMEKETWLAEPKLVFGRPAAGAANGGGLRLPAGMLLGAKVLDPTTMNPRSAEPVSVVEMAKRHFDPLPGFIQEVIKAIEAREDEDERASFPYPELIAFLDRVLAAKGDPLAAFVTQVRAAAFDPSRDPALGPLLDALRDRPYATEVGAMGDVVAGHISSFGELAARFYGAPLQPVAPSSRRLTVRGLGEGGVRFYFGTGADQRAAAPPPLVRQGERVRSEWLFHFLLDVQPIRPWLKIRMPSFRMTQEEARAIVAWFKALSDLPYANELFTEDRLHHDLVKSGEDLFGPPQPARPELQALQCNSCHPAGSSLPSLPALQPPGRIDPRAVPVSAPDDSFFIAFEAEDGTVAVEGGYKTSEAAQAAAEQRFGANAKWAVGAPWDKISWGPDLSTAARRLRPGWVRDWLSSPPDFMPGTKMPSYWPREKYIGSYSGHLEEKHLDAYRPGLPPEAEAPERRQAIEQLEANRRKIDSLVHYLMHMQAPGGVAQATGGDR